MRRLPKVDGLVGTRRIYVRRADVDRHVEERTIAA
jgi:hypothetical protein